jgi:hypothetical protein
MLKIIFFFLLIVFIVIQFIRPVRNNGDVTGPHDITHYVQVPDSVMAVLKKSCYDCHSNHTDYPWYTNINPVGWWMRGHINDGKRALNFSDLSAFSQTKLVHRLGDVTEQIEKHDMPLPSYLWIHKDAKLSDAEIVMLKNWTLAARAELAGAK